MLNPQSLTVEQIRDVAKAITGVRPSRQTIYNWIKKGWLQTVSEFRPVRATDLAVRKCVQSHCRR